MTQKTPHSRFLENQKSQGDPINTPFEMLGKFKIPRCPKSLPLTRRQRGIQTPHHRMLPDNDDKKYTRRISGVLSGDRWQGGGNQSQRRPPPGLPLTHRRRGIQTPQREECLMAGEREQRPWTASLSRGQQVIRTPRRRKQGIQTQHGRRPE